MRIPGNIPYLKAATALVGLYTVVWSVLEGRLAYDLLLAVPALALFMVWLVTRRLGGRVLPWGRGAGWVGSGSVAERKKIMATD